MVEATGNTPFSQRTPADFITLGDPRLTQVDTWLAISPANKVIVTHGETEFTGAPTGILMLVAEELNITDMSMMVYAHPESWLNSIGGGGGSGAIATRSTVARAAAAQALTLLLQAASTKLGVPVSGLSASNGVISGGGQQLKYSDLYGGQNFNFDLATLTPAVTTTTGYIPGQGNTKPVSQYQLVGQLVHRIDIPAKVAGTYTYIQNVRVPGMVHARRVRPRGAGANASQNHYPLSVDPTSVAHIPGVQVVQIGNFLAVVAPKEYDAIQAAAQLKVVWKDDPKFSVGSGNYWSWLRQSGDTNTTNPARWTADTGGVPAAMASAAKTVSATYRYHYNTYVPIGPHCAIADVRVGNPSDPTQNSATVYFCAQGTNPASGMGAGGGSTTPISTILAALPNSINIPQNQVRLIWYEGSGSYGAGQTPQAPEEAAVISATIGKPVRMQWMRWDQTGWDSWGPSQMYDVTLGANSAGMIVASDWTSYGQSGSTLDTDQELLGQVTWPAAPPAGGPTPSDGGSTATPYGNTNYGSAYQFQRRVLAKTQPFYSGSLKSTALRAPNAPQSYFASEQIVDELAHAMGIDPYSFRKRNIDGTIDDRGPLARGPRRGSAGVRIYAAGGELGGSDRDDPYRYRNRHGHVRELAVLHGGGRRGEHEDRQDGREAPDHRPKQRDHGQPRRRRQPDERSRHSGALPGDVGAGNLEHGAGHDPRLGHLPDPPLHGRSDRDARQRSPRHLHDGHPG